ncbi:MAG: hypothetical protein KDE34_07150 [Anaerolineales bacterium]|nr:hypothetical protein [Anaerolineales bacterium]
MGLIEAEVYLTTDAAHPYLEIKLDGEPARTVPFKPLIRPVTAAGGLRQFVAYPLVTDVGPWSFRACLHPGDYLPAGDNKFYTSRHRQIWLQNDQFFDYKPVARVSPSRIVKIDPFPGTMGPRPLYIYLPRGYREHKTRHYPVLYMQDGQNCFERFAADSYAGTWRADEIADRLIADGAMQECLIVGVGHGGGNRLMEYLPPYARLPEPLEAHPTGAIKRNLIPLPGLAEQTFRFYRDEVAPYLAEHFRIQSAREATAICGSSMGGLFALYVGWEHAEFVRNVAALSTSFWVTRGPAGQIEAIERLKRAEPRDIRLWLDSGTLDAPGRGDDGLALTELARDVLFDKGYRPGDNFHYHRADGATHSEAAWAARLDQVFRFLMPLR